MSVNLINLKHISLKEFYNKISKKKSKKNKNVADLLIKGLEISEVIDSIDCKKILYYHPNGEICVENKKFIEQRTGIPLYDLRTYYVKNTLLVNLINKKTNDLWKQIKFTTLSSAAKFSKVFNELSEEYMNYSEFSKIDYKYLKL